jgi:hypothetical protein
MSGDRYIGRAYVLQYNKYLLASLRSVLSGPGASARDHPLPTHPTHPDPQLRLLMACASAPSFFGEGLVVVVLLLLLHHHLLLLLLFGNRLLPPLILLAPGGGRGVGFALRRPRVAVREADLASWVVRVHEVVHDREYRAGGVDPEGDPPEELLVQPLLEVLEDEDADGEAGQGAGQVGHVRDRKSELLRRVPVVDGEAYVCAR